MTDYLRTERVFGYTILGESFLQLIILKSVEPEGLCHEESLRIIALKEIHG